MTPLMIYLVEGWDGGDTTRVVYAAFSEQSAAEEYCAELNLEDRSCGCEVREMELQ